MKAQGRGGPPPSLGPDGVPVSDQAPPPGVAPQEAPAPPAGEAEPAELRWEYSVPLLTNRFILYDLVKVVVISCLIMFVIVAVAVTVAGRKVDWFIISQFGMMAGIGAVVMFGLFVAVMGLFFLNYFPMGFHLTPKRAMVENLSRRGKVANRLSIILGFLAGRPGLAGAGFLGLAQETVGLEWNEVHRVKVHPRSRVISLMNSWRVVVRLYCTPENFAAVRRAAEQWGAAGSRRRERAARRAGPSPLPRFLLLSGGVLLAGLCLTPLPLEVPAILKVVAVAAGLLTLWFVPGRRFLGMVTLAAALFVAGNFTAQALETRSRFTEKQEQEILAEMRKKGHDVQKAPDWLNPRRFRFQSFAVDDWLGVGLASVGLAYLVWLGLAGMRRRLPSYDEPAAVGSKGKRQSQPPR